MKKKLNIAGFLNKPWVKNIAAPIVRGALQTIPGGGIVVQATRNITHELGNRDNVTVAINDGKPPHSYLSIAIQVVGIASIIYAFYTKAITVEQVLSLIGFTE